MIDLKTRLRVETSLNNSGTIYNERLIKILKEEHYYVKDIVLDGDAPKQFIQAYLFRENSGLYKRNPKTWEPYIAKTAEKWYPHESVIEFMINKIGQELGIRVNEVQLLRINGQIRFLSKFFLTKNELLVHGAEICGGYLGDQDLANEIANNQKDSRKLFTFEFISQAIRSIFPNHAESIIEDLVRLITYDAITGNNDRHFYNWGVITNKKKTNIPPILAPIYDSARGLFWNQSDDQLFTLEQNPHEKSIQVEKYLNKALPRISIEGDHQINHFGLVQFLKNINSEYRVLIDSIASNENEEKVILMLNEQFFRYFSHARRELVLLVLTNRFKKVREI